MPLRKVHIRPKDDENNDAKLLVLTVTVKSHDEMDAHEEAEAAAYAYMTSPAFAAAWQHGPALVTWSEFTP